MEALVKCVNCGQLWYCDEGDCCYFCAIRECDRCDKKLLFDEAITPRQVFGEDYFNEPDCSEFSDGAFNLCSDCITPAETACWKQRCFISWIQPEE